MGMSTRILGFKPPDERYNELLLIWKACDKAGISQPKEVTNFFGDEDPDPAGMMVELKVKDGVKPYRDEMCEGYEVDIRKLPKDIKILRFYNSY